MKNSRPRRPIRQQDRISYFGNKTRLPFAPPCDYQALAAEKPPEMPPPGETEKFLPAAK